MLPNIDAATALQLKGKPNVKLAETLELAYTLVGMNVSKPPFDNPKVREALNYALNRAGDRRRRRCSAPACPAGRCRRRSRTGRVDVKEFPCYTPDPAKAQALLKEAGVATPVAVTMNVLPRQDIKDIAQVVQEQLNKAGFKVELKNQELGQFVQDWRNSNFDLFASTNAGSADPDDYFFRTFRTGGSTNVFKYSDPELDELLDERPRDARSGGAQGRLRRGAEEARLRGPVAHLDLRHAVHRDARQRCRASTSWRTARSCTLRERDALSEVTCQPRRRARQRRAASDLMRSSHESRPSSRACSISSSCCSASRSSSS